jgi:FkbM family methyltransferase
MTAQERRLVLHHVGGRSGSRSFPVLPRFEGGFVNVLYDADAECVPQIAERWAAQPSMTRVLPYCLGASESVREFHINYDPYTSSLFPLNPRFAGYYYVQESGGYDYVLGDTLRTVQTVRVPTVTLDQVVLDRRDVPAPDFLSIDTQGAELEILQGAPRLLAGRILAVQLEVEFQPLYEGQPLFGDLCRLLDRCGYDLADVRIFAKKHPIRGKQGFRGEGYVTDGEALFLKRPDAIEPEREAPRALQLNKLAFIATVFGRFECAQRCFEAPGFEPLASSRTASGSDPAHLAFIARLAEAVARLPERSVPVFSGRFSSAQSRARFSAHGGASSSALRRRLAGIRFLAQAVRAARSARRAARVAALSLRKTLVASVVPLRWLLRRPGSPVEAVFLEFGMKPQFFLAARHRAQDARCAKSVRGGGPPDPARGSKDARPQALDGELVGACAGQAAGAAR